MKKALLILAVSVVLSACSKPANDVNIKSTFSSDVYTPASTMQLFMFGFMNFLGTAQYPVDWDNKIKSNKDYIILLMHNASTNNTSPCLVKCPMQQGTMLVESCL
ncbi:MAG: hypothetical protein K2Y14_11825 [Burkholderiales bacterium]|nr:hypothetical protein [Burkholderiales bacterium]